MGKFFETPAGNDVRLASAFLELALFCFLLMKEQLLLLYVEPLIVAVREVVVAL